MSMVFLGSIRFYFIVLLHPTYLFWSRNIFKRAENITTEIENVYSAIPFIIPFCWSSVCEGCVYQYIYALKVALFLLVYIWSLFLMKQYFWIRNVEGLVMLNKTFISLSFCSELTTTKSPTTITGMFLYLYSHSTYFFCYKSICMPIKECI